MTITAEEFNKLWNQATGSDGLPATIETPVTMTLEEWATGDHWKYEQAGTRSLKVCTDPAGVEIDIYELQEGSDKAYHL